jgi:DNA-binding response OmpR family regulator
VQCLTNLDIRRLWHHGYSLIGLDATRPTIIVTGYPSTTSVTSATRHLLVVDDDTELCQLLSEYLLPEGYDVEAVHSGMEGVERALSGEHALVVLDVMLPDVRGFEVLRQLRARSRMPVLMLTARGNEQDRILGLEMGADDYLPKPFNPRELCARVRTVLNRPFSPFDRSIDTHVSNLRRKLGPGPDGLDRIKSLRGVGYQYTFHHPSAAGEQ